MGDGVVPSATAMKSVLDIPLAIDRVEALSPALRYVALYPPIPGDGSSSSSSILWQKCARVQSDPVSVQIWFSPSSKWPNDIKAIRWLHFMNNYNWQERPLVVDPQNCMINADYCAILDQFEADRGENFDRGPAWYIVAPLRRMMVRENLRPWVTTMTMYLRKAKVVGRRHLLPYIRNELSHQIPVLSLWLGDQSS